MRSPFLFIAFFSFCTLSSSGQQQEKKMVQYTNYLLHVPDTKPGIEGYPLILFLHGSGERGDDLAKVKKHGPPSFLDDSTSFPFVVVSPQCPAGEQWDAKTLLLLLDEVEGALPIDEDRVYVTGLSMGGFGSWDLCQEAPDRFAAIAPICGGGDVERLCIMQDVPVWVFHGDKDTVVPPHHSEKMVVQLMEYGADVQFTLYPELDHDSWTVTYENPELYDWMLSKSNDDKRRSVDVSNDVLSEYTGTYIFEKDTVKIEYGEKLYVIYKDQKMDLTPMSNTKFRLPGATNDVSTITFGRNGKKKGFTTGPCEISFFRKVSKKR